VPDTVQRLDEVIISAQRAPSETRTAAPTQVVDAERIEHLGAVQLSDAVKTLAGITLKDYGGVGGVKTVSSRGLGSQFSAVTIDGIPVDDSQNGQVDLGRYTLGNTAYISFSQGQEQSSLLSARAYAAGNVLNMETAEPQFWPGEHVKLKAGIEGGSFGFFSPTAMWEQRWSKRLKTSFYANYLRSDGDYPFTLYYTASHKDSSSVERRKHSAVWMATADGNLFYTFGEGNTLVTKVHYMRGMHEFPGSVSLHSVAVSEQESHEELAFVQTRWRLERESWSGQLLGKIRYSDDQYDDGERKTHDSYRQREAYLSGSYHRELTQRLAFSLVADGSVSHLASHHNIGSNPHSDVTRLNLAAVAEAVYNGDRLGARAHLLLTDIRDRINDVDSIPLYRRLTPFVSLMYKIGDATTARLFYKQSYRVPTFGELYYYQIIPWDLRPELANQVNIGITHARSMQLSTVDIDFSATLDGYYNRVKDKIVAKPTGSMYYWSIENCDLVDILGVDATADFHLSPFTFHLNYSFQYAVDHTKEGGKTYGHQIVYIPRHSGGGSLRWENSWVNVGATVIAVGHRYSEAQNTSDSRLPAYCDITLSVDRSFDLRIGTLAIHASVLNLFDTQYEIIATYPMMGRHWKVGVRYEF
jgi:outer membrane cobalamin receptor